MERVCLGHVPFRVGQPKHPAFDDGEHAPTYSTAKFAGQVPLFSCTYGLIKNYLGAEISG